MRPFQLTTANIGRAFKLIPDTIILMSDRGTMAIRTEGLIHDVDETYSWTVEGDKSATGVQFKSKRAMEASSISSIKVMYPAHHELALQSRLEI